MRNRRGGFLRVLFWTLMLERLRLGLGLGLDIGMGMGQGQSLGQARGLWPRVLGPRSLALTPGPWP